MKKLVVVFFALVVANCAMSPPPMTDAERSAIATVEVNMSEVETIDILTRFLLSERYSIERYDEKTHILMTNWRPVGGLGAKVMVGKYEQKIQAMIKELINGSSTVEFWIYGRLELTDNEEKLNLYPARYKELVSNFKAFIGE